MPFAPPFLKIILRKYLNNMGCEKGLLVNFFESLEIMEVTKENSQKI